MVVGGWVIVERRVRGVAEMKIEVGEVGGKARVRVVVFMNGGRVVVGMGEDEEEERRVVVEVRDVIVVIFWVVG